MKVYDVIAEAVKPMAMSFFLEETTDLMRRFENVPIAVLLTAGEAFKAIPDGSSILPTDDLSKSLPDPSGHSKFKNTEHGNKSPLQESAVPLMDVKQPYFQVNTAGGRDSNGEESCFLHRSGRTKDSSSDDGQKRNRSRKNKKSSKKCSHRRRSHDSSDASTDTYSSSSSS